MRAIVQDRYGPPEQVLRLAERPVPDYGPHEVLVRAVASAVHSDVWHSVSGRPALLRLMGGGVRRPRQQIPGIDVAGVVEAVGAGVVRWAVGDRVVGGAVGANLWRNGGTLADYVVLDEAALEHKPSRLTWEEASALPSCGVLAVQTVRDEALVGAGQRVLINGAGGAVGTLAVQVAKARGAHVTAVDRASKAMALRALGADDVIDYEATDPADPSAGRESYDAIVDIASTRPFKHWRRVLASDGVYVVVGHDHFGRTKGGVVGSVPRVVGLSLRGAFTKQLAGFSAARGGEDRLTYLLGLAEAGVVTPLIDRVFPLSATVEALQHLTTEEAVGRVVVRVATDETPPNKEDLA